MVDNFPGPYEIEMFYTVGGLQHTQRLNCFVDGSPPPGTPIVNISLNQRDFTLINVDTAVLAWVALIENLFNDTVTFDNYNVWQYTPLTYIKTFIAANTIGLPGTHVNPSNLAHQMTMTHRTIEGGILRIVLLESISQENTRVPYASAPADVQAVMDYVTRPNSWILARDTSYAIANLNYSTGENEAIFKERYR